ncbi:hypothetical protein ABIA00_003124 [Bradyrhizobium ottawaense]
MRRRGEVRLEPTPLVKTLNWQLGLEQFDYEGLCSFIDEPSSVSTQVRGSLCPSSSPNSDTAPRLRRCQCGRGEALVRKTISTTSSRPGYLAAGRSPSSCARPPLPRTNTSNSKGERSRKMQDDAPSRGNSRQVSITKRARSRGPLPTSGMASATQASSSSLQTTRSKRRRRAVARRYSFIPAKASNAAAAKTRQWSEPRPAFSRRCRFYRRLAARNGQLLGDLLPLRCHYCGSLARKLRLPKGWSLPQ